LRSSKTIAATKVTLSAGQIARPDAVSAISSGFPYTVINDEPTHPLYTGGKGGSSTPRPRPSRR
jgi:hypothetical protein